MSIPEKETTYSVSLRLRRVTFDYAYVSVPVVDNVVKPDEQGVNRIDFGELTRMAIEMSQSPEVVWYREEQNTEPHPVQKAPDEGEKRFAN
jgi:hypothetical protein